MAKRSFSTAGSAFVAVADGLLTAPYMGIIPGGASQLVNVLEISLSGQAAASTLANALFARSSTKAATPTAIASPFTDGLLNNAGTGLSTAVVTFSTASTQSTRTSTTTDARLNLSLNGFGGIYRWVAAPGEEWVILGNANPSESTLSLTNANSGVNCSLGAHIVYEPF
jgi:hypothetical protein